jgi:hypothetical protein
MNVLQARAETIVNAPTQAIWAVITDIDQLHKINPGVVKASGRMDKQGELRTCEIINNGRKGTMVEKLIEFVPERKTVWTIQSDTMGMSKMLRDTRFVFNIERISENQTKLISETYYVPSNILVSILNRIVLRRVINKAQNQILANITVLLQK